MNNLSIKNLVCNYKSHQLGMDSCPYFSWQYEGDYSTFIQKSYQLIVSDAESDIVFNSGEVVSSKFTNIKYIGVKLLPRSIYYYKVLVKGEKEELIKSDVSSFETGKKEEIWESKWITAGNIMKPDKYTHAPYLRKTFNLPEDIKSARLYITGLGYFEAYINGKKTGDDLLSPAFTNYDHTILYHTYDVTNLLSKGDNVLGGLLGNGWYNCITQDIWNIKEVSWRHVPKMIAELRITLASGKELLITTDSTWKSTNSPITFNSIRNGEYYDANLETPNWNTINCNDSDWDNVKIIRAPGGLLTAMEMEPIRKTGIIKPINYWKSTKDSWVFDLGQNMSGFVKLEVAGKKGDEITIIYNEKLMDNGIDLDRIKNSGFTRTGEFQTDKYIKKSDDVEIWSPRFVYHGFQYIELVGLTTEPTLSTALGVIIHTDIPRKGEIKTSNDILNKVVNISHWSTIGNFHGLLTDSPHREKNSWTGDASLSSEQTMFNYITINEFKKWLYDIKDSQKPSGVIPCVVPSTGWGYNWGNGPDWSSALTLIPWYLYTHYGDIQILEEMYETITKHCSYMETMAENYIVNYGIGDWCAPFEGPSISINMSSFKAPTELTDTAYFYNAADTISKIAFVLGKAEDVKIYQQLAKNIKKSFRNKYFNKERMTVSGNCQTSTACMLFQGLANEDEKEALTNLLLSQIEKLDNHLDFGVLGNKYVLNSLGVVNHFDSAIKMITQETFPGFGNIIKLGATTLWETWNGTGSYNHHMFSDIVASMYKYLGGIRPDENTPGYEHIIMQPDVDCGLTSVDCYVQSLRGKISTSWKKQDNNLTLNITIPYGCKATLYLPIVYASMFKSEKVTINDKLLNVTLPAGDYKLST
ncbi:MAG: family 78 glycoside hydrolase catalytic domain [Clostridiales bacterium]|nr:family 78 glycoside hydrolase catalytic domain [Clostridiales bacterium]